MHPVLVIALKETSDVLRDRRTLVFMMLLPIVVMPLMMLGVSRFVVSQAQKRAESTVTVVADTATKTTLTALARRWFQDNKLALGALEALRGAEAAGGLANLGRLLEGGATDGEAPGIGALLKATADMDPRQRQLMQDAAAVQRFIGRTTFVPPAEVAAGGALAPGVEVPEGLPGGLDDPRLTVALQDKRVELAVHVPSVAMAQLDEAAASVTIHALYDSSLKRSEEAYDRLAAFVQAVDRHALSLRLVDLGLPRDFAQPLVIAGANVATASRRVQAVVGGLLPYLLFAFCFFGALYPALDVTAGEKERFTLETLLLAPTSRMQIATGKFVVVFVAAIVAALLTTASMVVTFTHGILPADVAQAFEIEFQPLALLLTASLILPVAALYSSMLLAVGLYARSFKEAQSYTVPLQFLFVLPMMVSLIPDVEAEPHLAWIPFVNISMLMRELLKGNYLWSFYGITLGSTLVLTVGALLLAARLFRREGVLLRS